MFSGQGIIVGACFLIAGAMVIGYGLLLPGLAVIIGGTLLLVVIVRYGRKYLRKSGVPRQNLIVDVIDMIIGVFL